MTHRECLLTCFKVRGLQWSSAKFPYRHFFFFTDEGILMFKKFLNTTNLELGVWTWQNSFNFFPFFPPIFCLMTKELDIQIVRKPRPYPLFHKQKVWKIDRGCIFYQLKHLINIESLNERNLNIEHTL